MYVFIEKDLNISKYKYLLSLIEGLWFYFFFMTLYFVSFLHAYKIIPVMKKIMFSFLKVIKQVHSVKRFKEK